MADATIYVPVGFQCTTAEILKKQNKRVCSFPFDWIISTPESVVKLLTILLQDNINIAAFVREEFFKIDGLLHVIRPEEFILHPGGNILYNSKHGLIFPHFSYNNETIENFVRRFERLRNYILHSNNTIKFVFVNRLINNNNDIVNNNSLKFSINNRNTDLNITQNFTQLNNILLQYIPPNRFKIIIINAVNKFRGNLTFDNNIIYNELIPGNRSNLTDEEILQITI